MGKYKKQFIEIFELSPEIAMDLPLIMMIGDREIYLENHKGISHFQDKEIKIKTKSGFLVLKGQGLLVKEINDESISIYGKILSLSYENRMEGIVHD